MACYNPLKGWRDKSGAIVFSERVGCAEEIIVPCYTCIGCRIARSRQWALRIVHESKLHDCNSFVTLTYSPEHLPENGTLRYDDVQRFHKRLRKAAGPFRFFVVGEYGENLSRPHYHACYFGYFPKDARRLQSLSPECQAYSSESLSKTWGLGHVHIGTLTYQSAAYCSGYIFKKQYGSNAKKAYELVDSDGVILRREPEFARMSLRPGIGGDWYRRYSEDFHGPDIAVHDGKQFAVPKYYDRLLERSDPKRYEQLKEDRAYKMLRHADENTWWRLQDKAEVALAGLLQRDERLGK